MRRVGREFLNIFAIATALLSAGAGVHYYSEAKAGAIMRTNTEPLNVALGRTSLVNELATITSDLLFLAEHNQLEGNYDRFSADNRAILGRTFLAFSGNKYIYDQIRLLDGNGTELVRVNYGAGNPRLVPDAELQDKAGRYYFRNTWGLAAGEFYVSPLDLNVEHGAIETPHKPVLRIGTPVFGRDGVKRGVLLLNYKGERLLARLRQATSNIAERVMLTNAEGYWLSSPRRGEEWGFMLPHGLAFKDRFAHAWTQIQRNVEGQVLTDEGLFTYSTVVPAWTVAGRTEPPRGLKLPDRYWKVITFIPESGLTSPLPFSRHMPLYAFMLGLLTLGSAFLARIRVKHNRVEMQLEAEQRFRSTLENIDLPAVGMNRNGGIVFCNDALLQLLDRQRAELLNGDWFELCVPESQRTAARDRFRLALTHAAPPLPHEGEIITGNGQARLIAWNDSITPDASGAAIGLTCIGQDITDARRREELLRKLSQAVEQSPSVVTIVNTDAQIEYVNPKFTELTGYTLDDVVGRNPNILKSGYTRPEEYKYLWTTIKNGGEWRGVFHNRKKNGELYWESASVSPIRNQEGEITHFLAVKEDITERKRLEAEIVAHNREIARNQALAAIGRMASMVAHDLRNPLSSIKMGLQILGKRILDSGSESDRELQQIATQQVAHMEEVLSDLLGFSRPESLHPQWVDVAELVETSCLLIQRQLDEFGVRVTTGYASGLPRIYADGPRLRQALSNIVINAAQAMNETRAELRLVEIDVDHADIDARPGIDISIRDKGPGLDPAIGERVFEPFFTTRANGTGLGLAIVEKIVESHAGKVSLEVREEGGTRVRIRLPIRPAWLAADATESCSDPAATAIRDPMPAQQAKQ